MKRVASAAVGIWLWAACAAANACSCVGIEAGLGQWVEKAASEADRIVLATVTAVTDSNHAPPNRAATVKVLRSLKGSGSLSRVEEARLCQNFRLKKAETRVFFTDKNGVILPCSDYRPWLKNDGLILELERVLKKRAT